MRTEKEALRSCPLCGTKTTPGALGLRDYRWVNGHLPGRVGLMDIDGCLNQAKTDRVLIFEFKPDHAPLSKGARITFDILWRKGIDAVVVWDHGGDRIAWTWWDGEAEGDIEQTEGTRDELAAQVRAWWDEGLAA